MGIYKDYKLEKHFTEEELLSVIASNLKKINSKFIGESCYCAITNRLVLSIQLDLDEDADLDCIVVSIINKETLGKIKEYLYFSSYDIEFKEGNNDTDYYFDGEFKNGLSILIDSISELISLFS